MPRDKQYTLDGELVDPPPYKPYDPYAPRKLPAMIAIYGQPPEGVKCGDCQHFLRVLRNTKIYRKCLKYGDTRGEATDWLAGWKGCGAYAPEAND